VVTLVTTVAKVTIGMFVTLINKVTVVNGKNNDVLITTVTR
jgi:hypothetical protein